MSREIAIKIIQKGKWTQEQLSTRSSRFLLHCCVTLSKPHPSLGLSFIICGTRKLVKAVLGYLWF